MKPSTLRLGSPGFTVIPNQFFDTLANKGSNALALGSLLLRLVPGQTGEIVLAGNTSRRNICAMLQWGTENSAKFDQALAAIASTGLVSIRIEGGNCKIITVDGRLDAPALKLENQLDATESVAQDITPAKLAPLKTARSAEAKIAPPAMRSTHAKENKLKNKLNNLTHLRAADAGRDDDDTVKNLFSHYAERFKTTISRSQRARFLASIAENHVSPEELLLRIDQLAEHPLMAVEVTSINALWHFTHLKKRASQFDQRVKESLEDLARRHSDEVSFRQALAELVKTSYGGRLDLSSFYRYFNETISTYIDQWQHQSLQQIEQVCELDSLPPPNLDLQSNDLSTDMLIPLPLDCAKPETELIPGIIEIDSVSTEPDSITSASHVSEQQNASDFIRVDISELLQTTTKTRFLEVLEKLMQDSSFNATELATFSILHSVAVLPQSSLGTLKSAATSRFKQKQAA